MVDLDALFSYKTIKIVTIQDRRLGILHYLFKLGILVYIIVYTLIIQQRYLLTEPPFGSIRATVREPPRAAWLPAEQYPYCAQGQAEVNGFSNYQCIYVLGYDMVYPPAPLNSIFVSTRVKDTTFANPPGCGDPYTPTTSACIPNQTGSTSMYTAGVEDFTLYIEHSIYGRITDTKQTNGDIKGELTFQRKSDKTIKFDDLDRTGDIIDMRTVLRAAGLDSLDVKSKLPNSTDSLRYDGVLLMMVITYSNNPQHPSTLTYSYEVQMLEGVDVVAMEPTVIHSSDMSVHERTRHGINILFLVSGSVGKFDFPTLLLTVVSGAVLLGVATTIVDLLLLYVMPDRAVYKRHKYELTEDFSDLRGDAMRTRQKYGET